MKKQNTRVYSYDCSVYPTKLDIMFDINNIDYMNNNYAWESDPECKFVFDDDQYGSNMIYYITRKQNIRQYLLYLMEYHYLLKWHMKHFM